MLPELLPEEEREWAYELFKKYGGEKAFSMWVDMVQTAGEETAFGNIVNVTRTDYPQINDEFLQVMYTALKHHLNKQQMNN